MSNTLEFGRLPSAIMRVITTELGVDYEIFEEAKRSHEVELKMAHDVLRTMNPVETLGAYLAGCRGVSSIDGQTLSNIMYMIAEAYGMTREEAFPRT